MRSNHLFPIRFNLGEDDVSANFPISSADQRIIKPKNLLPWIASIHGPGNPIGTKGGAAMSDMAKTEQRLQRPFLNTEQAAFYLCIGWRKLMKMRTAGEGPAYRRHGRLIFYHIDDLEEWSRATSKRAGQ